MFIHLFNNKNCTPRACNEFTSEAFLAAVMRFIAIRGRPATLVTDNGTKFEGARKELEAGYKVLTTQDAHKSLNQFLADQRITWQHSPAHSSYFGGIWEVGVKKMKALLYKTLVTQKLTTEEMYTILLKWKRSLIAGLSSR